MFKKYLCLMLCVLLALSTLSTAAFAANYTYSVNNLSASAVTFTVGGNAVIDLPTTESSVTATVNVTNSDASAQGVVFWIGKYVDGVLEDVVYCSDTSVAAAATEELSATISNVKKETGEKTVGSTTVTYDKVVLKAYVWTNTGKAIAKEANLPNIGAGLHFLKNGAPIATTDIAPKFSEADTDYTVVLKRNPAEFASFRMVSGDNTTTIVQPEEYNLNGNNVVTVTKKAVNAETGAVEDVTTTYNFKIAYETPVINFVEDDAVSSLSYKLLEYVEGDTFSPTDTIFVNRGGSESSGEKVWYASAVGEKLRGLNYFRGRDNSKDAKHSGTLLETSANIKAKLASLKTSNIPLISFTAEANGILYALASEEISDYDGVNGWTKLGSADGHTAGGSYTLPGDAVITNTTGHGKTGIEGWIRSSENTSALADENAPINKFMPSNMPYSIYAVTTKDSSANSDSGNQHSLGSMSRAYKKTIVAGETVNIESPGSRTYTPLYFIEWEIPTPPDMDNADITSASYSVDSTPATLTAGDFVWDAGENAYLATVNLLEAATISGFDVTLAEPAATKVVSTETVTVADADPWYVVATIATVTSADTNVTKVYKIKFTVPAPDMTDASIKSVTFNANAAPASPVPMSLAAADFSETSTNVYEANVSLAAGTTDLSNIAVEAIQAVATVTSVPTTVTFASGELTKTVTIATITSGDTTKTIEYKINFTLPVSITWTEPAEVSALPYKYVEYVEGDTFSAGDGLYVNRGGSESGQTAWYATAIGEKLKGLDYIRGRELSKASNAACGSVPAADIKSALNDATNGFIATKTPLLSFTANIGGTIYAVAPHASNDDAAKFAVFTDAEKVPAGGVWTSLDGVDGHVNANFAPDHTAMADYNATADTSFALYMKNRYSTRDAANAFRTNLTAWPNNISVSNKPYGFAAYAAETSGYNSKPAFAHAYKKEFNAGDTVNIPAFNDGTYTPIYFIKWDDTTSGGGTPPTASPEPTTPPAPTEPPIPTEPPTPTASPEPSTPPTSEPTSTPSIEPSTPPTSEPTATPTASAEPTATPLVITWYDSTTDLNEDGTPDGLALNAAGTEIKTGVEVYTEVNAPIIENLKVYSTSSYTLHNLGTEFFGTNLLMRTTDQLAKTATESSNPHRRPVFYTETTADSGEALVSFSATQGGVLYALMNNDLSTYSTTTAGAAGEKWTKINNGVIPYGPDGTTKLDASKSYTITNTNLSETVYNAIAAATSKGGVNRTTNYAETITGGFLPTSSSDNNAHKYYATLTRTQSVSSSTDFFEAVQADYATYNSANPSAYAPTSYPSFQYETSYDGAKSNPAYFPMKYVYKIEFNAGDIVKIPAIPYKYGINGTETLYTMPVFLVKWGATSSGGSTPEPSTPPTSEPTPTPTEDPTTVYVGSKAVFKQFQTSTFTLTAGGTGNMIEYMEDSFGLFDTALNGVAWKASAIGEKIDGLSWFRGYRLDKAGSEDIYTVAADDTKALFSFEALSDGTIYVASYHNLDDYYTTGTPVGGVWTTLNGVDGHVNNANISLDYKSQSRYSDFLSNNGITAGSSGDNFKAYMKWLYPKTADETTNRTINSTNFLKNADLWPNNASMADKPYGFTTFADETTGLNSQITFGYVYKKTFSAGEKVEVPAPHCTTSNKYMPVYLVDWTTPTVTPPAQSSDATLSKLVYTVGAETAEYTVTDFDVTDEGGTYNVTLPEGTTSITLAATKNDENASISGVPTAAVTFVKNGTVAERTKQVVITVTAQDSTVKTYTINFVSPIVLELTTTADRLAGKAMSNTVAWGDTAKPATHDMLTLVNAPLKANLDLYVARTYGLGQLGSAWLDESVNLLAKVEAIPNVGENSQGKTVAQRYRETDPGDALYSFVAPKGGTVYALTDVNMAATFTDGDGTDAGAIWTVLNNGVVPYGPDNTTKLDANKTIDITTATTKYASNATFKLSATQINNGDGSKGLENFTEAAKQMKYAALIPSSFTPTSQEGTGEEYKYYATMFMSANANLYNNATIGIEAAYANTTGTVDAPEFAYVTQGYDSKPAAIKSVIPMKYCYSLPFDEGDTVEIPCWPNDKSSSTGMIVLVKWNN